MKGEQRVAAENFADSLSELQDPKLEPRIAGGKLNFEGDQAKFFQAVKECVEWIVCEVTMSSSTGRSETARS